MLGDSVHALVVQKAQHASYMLHLFDGPYVTCGGHRTAVPEGSKRLLAFVALHGGQVERRYAAGTLWPVGDEVRAAGNLRSALWRIKRAAIPILSCDKHGLALNRNVLVDANVVTEWASRLIQAAATPDDLDVVPWGLNAVDLLPGWYDDWVLIERERIRQRLLHGLEALSRQLLKAGRCADAIEAAMMAVRAEPLRESAQRALIEAHLAEGNWFEGRRSYEAYRQLLARELGVRPDPELTAVFSGRAHGAIAVGERDE
jgi:DNA-binding SARP family transcriptional activator